jgi:nicotinamidase-related amidase
VVYTRDVGGSDEVYEIHRGAWNFKTGMTGGSQRLDFNTITPLLEPKTSEPVIEKSKPSAFFGTPLIAMLNYLGVDSLIITGMVTSGCIRATVVDAFSYNFHVNIPVECVTDRSRISHEVTLFDIDTKYANVMPLDQVILELDKLSK